MDPADREGAEEGAVVDGAAGSSFAKGRNGVQGCS